MPISPEHPASIPGSAPSAAGYPRGPRDPERPHHVILALADALPAGALARLRGARDALSGDGSTDRAGAEPAVEWIGEQLNAGRGGCWLRDPRMARSMAFTLRLFDELRYDLGPWVILPNHLRVIVRPLPGGHLGSVLRGWTGFSECEFERIHRRLPGPLWDPEPHVVPIPDGRALIRLSDAIRLAPVRAGLCRADGEWPWVSSHPRWGGDG